MTQNTHHVLRFFEIFSHLEAALCGLSPPDYWHFFSFGFFVHIEKTRKTIERYFFWMKFKQKTRTPI